MIRFTIRILGNVLALYTAYTFIPGFSVIGNIRHFLIAGALLGLLNTTVRPVLRLISMPLIILTLGLFALVINALILWTVGYLFDFIVIQNLNALIWATIVVGIVNAIISLIAKMFD